MTKVMPVPAEEVNWLLAFTPPLRDNICFSLDSFRARFVNEVGLRQLRASLHILYAFSKGH